MSRGFVRLVAILLFAFFPCATLHATVLIATNPVRNAKAAARTTNIQATADGNIQSSSVTQSTFRIQGEQTGRIAGTYSTSGATFSLDPTNELKPGELIRVSATSGIQNTSAVALTPQVWQFTAATALSTGVMRAHPVTPSFGSGGTYGAALGDLDGDGDLDAVLVNNFNDTNSVWLNDGSGNFSAHPTTPTFGTAAFYSAVALGDVDNDGDLDAVAISNIGKSVWANDGSGNLTSLSTFSSGESSYDIALGDIDRDGDLDAVVANLQTVAESVWVNDGSGTFTAHPTTPTFNAGSYTNGLDLGDVDSDGDLDVFLAQGSSSGGAEAVFLNDGSGNFTAHPTVPTFGGGTSMDAALGDLDGDGDLDAVVANFYSSGGKVWMNGGSGDFTAHPTTPTLPAFDQHDVALGDVDGDGDLDAVFADLNGWGTAVWLNDGAGNFTAHPTMPTFGAGAQSADIALGDLDGDGDLDVLVGNDGAETVWVNNAIRVTPTAVTTAESGATGTFTVVLEAQPSANVTMQIDTSDNTEGRLSTDGVTQQDSVTLTFTNANWSSPQTVTAHGQNDSVDDGNIAYTITTNAATSSDARFANVNPSDVSATNVDDDTSGVSVTPAAVTVAESGTTATFDVALTSEPLGNVRIDMVSGDTSEATISHSQVTFTNADWSTPQTITVTGVGDIYDDGNVTSTIALTTNTTFTNDAAYDAINPPDVIATTNDDDIGVFSTSPASNAIDIPRNTNIEATAPDSINGATVTQATFPVRGEQTGRINGAYSTSGALFWLDPASDLKPGELIHATVTNSVQTGSAVPLGPHVWQFTAATSVASGAMVPHPVNPSFYLADTYGVALGDLDDDGDLDAVTANWADVAERVWMNDGTGNFSAHGTTPSFGTGFSGDVALGDLDGDGDLDAIVANWWNAAETIWLNDGDGNLTAPVSNASFGAGESMKVALGDIDGDGDLDAVIANDAVGPETVWLNNGSAVFTAHPSIPSFGLGHSWSIALGDIDNDGDLDAVVANREAEAETVWLNDGSGRFTAHPTAPTFGAGSYSYGLALGDVDGDGDLDAVVANGNGQADTVWMNNGTGVFTSSTSFGTGEGRDVALGDIDGDGDLDAVVANYSSEAETVWLNTGGAFSAHPSYPSFGVSNSLCLALGDIDGDGDLDTFVGNGTGEAETVWINRPAAGVVVTPSSGLTTTEAGGTATFTIALASAPLANVVINLSSSDTSEGTVSPAQVTFTTGDWSTPQTITITGQNDAIDDGNIAYTIITGSATSTDPLYSGLNATDVSATNNDDADTAGVIVSESTVTVRETGTTATFTLVLTSEPAGDVVIDLATDNTAETSVSPAQVTFNASDWSTPQTITVTGVDDESVDGNVSSTITVTTNTSATTDPAYDAIDPNDVTATTTDDDFVIVAMIPARNARSASRTANVLASASGIAQAASVTSSTYRVSGEFTGRIAGTTTSVLASMYLDPTNALKHGEKVHVTATSGILGPNGAVLVPEVWQFTAAAGEGTGVFAAHPTTPAIGGTDISIDVALGDLDGDGDLDAIVANQNAENETVWANDGAGNFTALSTFDGGWYNRAIALGDLDGDGDLDALLAGATNERVMRNNGSGVFTPHPVTPDFGGSGETVALGDLDGDGDLDAIIAIFNGPETVWLNDGTGAFSAHPVDASFGGGDSESLGLGDLDGDGDLDVIVGNAGDGAQPETVWLNDGTGVFSAHTTPNFGGGRTFEVALGDLDGDGDLDALCVNGDGAETVWLNDGSGAFTQTATLSGTITSYDGDLADIDGDGDLDALIVDVEVPERVWLNDGSGGFTEHPIAQPFTNDATFASALGDIDGDGDLDAVLANYASVETVWINREPAGITVTPASGLVTTEAGGTATFDVVLTSQPVANVVIDMSSSDGSEANVSPAQLTFTTSNWSTPQTVTVTGQNDDVDDGDIAYTIITGAAVSTDPLYSGFNAADVSASNTDDDTAGVTVSINSWTQLFPAGTSPSARAGSGGGAYDTVHDRLTFFSGNTGPSRPQDTWLLTNATGSGGTPSWTQLSPTGGPPTGRHGHRSVYAASSNRMIVYGGCTASCGVGLSDAWALTNANGTGGTPAWISLAGGANRHAYATGYDPSNNRMMVYGGFTHLANSCMTNEQVLTNADGTGSSSWSALSPGAGPGARGEDVNGAYDAVSNRLIVFGGNDCSTMRNDVWVLTNANGLGGTPAWVQLAPAGTVPSGRNYHSTIYDENTNRIIVFGGNDGFGNLNETWVLTNANGLTGTPEWIRQKPSGALPPARRMHLFAYSPSSNRMMIAMGELPSGYGSDVWVLNNANGTLTVAESGTTATFTVVLDSEPTGDVVIDVTSLDTSEATVSPSQLTFTSGTWSTPQTVTVTGVSDAIIDGNVQTTISVAMNTASTIDAVYDAIDPDDVTAVTTDDDFVIVSTDPPPNVRNVSRTANIEATASGNVQPSTVTSSTYRVQGEQTGRIAGSTSGGITAITLDPSSSLKPGEKIHITATSGILGPNNAALVPRVWQLTAAAGAATGVFAQHASFGIADNSMDLALGDLDGDGDIDAVIANASDQPETVWLNDGAGNFTAHPTTPTFGGDNTQAVVLGDIDGDGDLDALAGADGLNENVTVWLNDGSGTFSAHGTPKFGNELDLAWDLALGDLDADGDLDVVVANADSYDDTVWLNDGSGVFTPHPVTPTINAGVSNGAIALGDIDVDGDLDLVSANTNDQAETVFLNDGTGSFSAHPTTPTFGAGKSAGIALGDLDGDGDLDAFVANGDAMQPETVWLNDGAGTFSAHPTTPSFGFEDGWDVALGDIDGDGDLDAIVANIGGGDGDTIWLNDGAANFSAHPIVDRIDQASTSPAVALGDVDGDGDLDAVFANESAAETVWINRSAAGITVTPTSGLTTTEAGGEATFTVVLTSQPVADVVIDVSSSDTSEATVLPAQLTFTNANWSSAQTVTVTGQNDAIDDGSVAYTITTAAAVSSDPLYSGFNASDVTATNDDDDDTAGVSVAGGPLTVSEDGTTDTFTIVLESEPVGDVVIDVSSTDTGEATVSPSQLTFTTANWSTPQTVTVTGVDDAIIDGNASTAITVAMNTGATNDALYDAIDPNDVTATTTDDDFAIVSTNPAANAKAAPRTTNVEATASGTVQPATVTQTSYRVHGEQTGRIAGSHGASGTTITLDPSNNLKPGEKIHVTATNAILGPNDSALVPRVWQFTASASVASAAMIAHPTTPEFGGTDQTGDVALGDVDGDGDLDAILVNQSAQNETVWANDGAGNFTALSTFDGGWYTKKIELGDLDGDGDLDALFAGSDNERVMLNNGSGTFTAHPVTPDFGGSGQNVALGDLDADGDLDAIVAMFAGPETIWLNDGTGVFSAHPTAASFGSDDSESVVLGDLDGDGDLDAIVGNTNSQAETVWLNDGTGVFSAHATPSFGGGSTFDVVLGDVDADGDLDVLCVNGDGADTVWTNDGTGAFTQQATLSGANVSYDADLGDLDGDGDLDVLIVDVNGTERVFLNDGTATFAPHPLVPTFTGTQSDASALGDIDGDGDLDAVIANYAAPASVWINRPIPGITVTPTSGLTTTEAGGEDTFTVVLTTQPSDDVVIDVSSSDSSEASASPAQLTFTSANWSTPQTVTAHGENDAIDDGNVAYTITTAPAVSTDPLYSGLNAADVSATNDDDGDTAGVTVASGALSVSESGTTATFTVVLDSEPTGNVVIDVSSTDTTEATVSPSQLTFTNADWSTPQTVTITGVDDALDDGDQTTTIDVAMNAAATDDSLYDAIDPNDVTATTVDDDAPFGAPPNFLATATGTTTVATSWTPVAGATSYEVWRTTSIGNAYTLVDTTTSTSFNDSGLSANTTYLYKVRANGSGGPSAFSNVDPATTVVFTDPVLTTSTLIQAVHVTQLRTAVNAMRAAAELGAASFTDPAPVTIKRIHIIELRTALDDARAAIGLAALIYTDPTITAGTTVVKREHIAEPRAGTQ